MTMREKMARAILAKADPKTAWDDMPDIARERAFGLTDAALSALEEPTEAMVRAAPCRTLDRRDTGPTHYHDIFRAMIRAAKEG